MPHFEKMVKVALANLEELTQLRQNWLITGKNLCRPLTTPSTKKDTEDQEKNAYPSVS